MGASNIITGVINVVTFLSSVAMIGGGIWLSTRLSTHCVHYLRWPVIVLGLVILLLSCVGCLGAFCRHIHLLYIYLFLLFLLILLLLAFTIFAFVVVNDGPSSHPSPRTITYPLRDFSPWLQDRVKSDNAWVKVKRCLIDAGVCRKLDRRIDNQAIAQFDDVLLSSVESGCCMPPAVCGFTIAAATLWNNPTNISATPDCSLWRNDQSQLCYDCDSCRGGVLASVKEQWQKIGVLSVVVLALLILIYAIAYCAFQSSLKHHLRIIHREPSRSRRWRRCNWFTTYS